MWQMCHVNVRILHLSTPHTEPLGCIDEEQADAQIQEGLAKVDHLLALEVDRKVGHGKIRALQQYKIKIPIISFGNFDIILCRTA